LIGNVATDCDGESSKDENIAKQELHQPLKSLHNPLQKGTKCSQDSLDQIEDGDKKVLDEGDEGGDDGGYGVCDGGNEGAEGGGY